MDFLYELIQPENLVVLAVGALVFLTLVTLTRPFFEKSDLKERMNRVALERDKLRSKQKAELERAHANLREKPNGLVAELVRALNLHSIMDAESYRARLRQAGLRQEKHLIMLLAAKLISPFLLGVLAYLLMLRQAPDAPAQLRIAGTFAGVVAGYYLPSLYLANLIQKRRDSIRRAWSDALDLMLICVESGMSIEMALQRVAKEIGKVSPPLAEELLLTNAELSYLGNRTQAMENLAERVDLPAVRSVVNALIQSEKYGTPLGQSLRVLAQENRNERMAEVEKKAAALPPKLTVPMIAFFMPAIFVVLLGPAAIMFIEHGSLP